MRKLRPSRCAILILVGLQNVLIGWLAILVWAPNDPAPGPAWDCGLGAVALASGVLMTCWGLYAGLYPIITGGCDG